MMMEKYLSVTFKFYYTWQMYELAVEQCVSLVKLSSDRFVFEPTNLQLSSLPLDSLCLFWLCNAKARADLFVTAHQESYCCASEPTCVDRLLSQAWVPNVSANFPCSRVGYFRLFEINKTVSILLSPWRQSGR